MISFGALCCSFGFEVCEESHGLIISVLWGISYGWCLLYGVFGSGVSALSYIELMSTKRRRRSIKLLICPGCEEEGTLRKILYGMPDPEVFDFEKYAVGGCCFNGDGSDPDIACRECEWEGIRVVQFGD